MRKTEKPGVIFKIGLVVEVSAVEVSVSFDPAVEVESSEGGGVSGLEVVGSDGSIVGSDDVLEV